MRLLTVVSVFALFVQPQFAVAPKKSPMVLNEHKLPMPSVRFVRKVVSKETSSESHVPSPSYDLNVMQMPPQAAELNPAPSDGFLLTVGLTECTPWKFCKQKPSIEIRATGQFNHSKIVKIQVQVGEQGKVFDGETIKIRLPPTQGRGDWLNYWAITENGTKSPVNFIKYLSYKTDGQQDEEYYFALLGAEWADGMPSGSLLWEMFPPMGAEFPVVLEQPLTAGYLYTTNHYSYLAGHLIISGTAKGIKCTDGGVYSNGYATACGEQQAAEEVLEWQNRYDKQIYASSIQNNIPARILKAMVAQETQFWPSLKNPYEIGLGSLTQNGVDMLLAWNKKYFLALCSAAYDKRACSGGYSYMSKNQQVILRHSVWEKALSKDEIDILGAVLFASAAQVNQMVSNTWYASPGDVASYEDMWKIAVANYHSGSGCIGTAMTESAQKHEAFTWKGVRNYLLGDCKQAIMYVDNVWRYAGGQP